MTAVFAVRHPQTTWNAEQRYQGRLNAPLSATGRDQAKLVASTFEGCDIAAVWSSPLERATDLARLIAQAADSQLHCDERLSEIDMGPWQGLYRQEIEERYPDMYRKWYAHPDDFAFPDGESIYDVERRTREVLAEVFARYPSDNVVVVTHSAVIQTMVATGLGLSLGAIHRIRISNCGITTICGTHTPASILSLNVTEPLYHSPVAAATCQDCVSWKERAPTT